MTTMALKKNAKADKEKGNDAAYDKGKGGKAAVLTIYTDLNVAPTFTLGSTQPLCFTVVSSDTRSMLIPLLK